MTNALTYLYMMPPIPMLTYLNITYLYRDITYLYVMPPIPMLNGSSPHVSCHQKSGTYDEVIRGDWVIRGD